VNERRPTQLAPTRVFCDGAWSASERQVIGETAVAIVVNGGAEAVMMATAVDLEDFALGFALTEGLVRQRAQIRDLEIVEAELGVEVRLWLTDDAAAVHVARRRQRAGPVGCGLCGVESLEEAMRPLANVKSASRFPARNIIGAMRALTARQPMNTATRAAHAAALYVAPQGILHVREDIGRHNALDKLVGALVRAGQSPADGVVLLTSRVSIELAQKTAYLGSPVLAAVSAPSALAIEAADKAGITLCGVVRDNGLEVFSHAERII
jgi:FdhD protein